MENATWDEATDQYITRIEAKVGNKYNLSLRVLMSNPEEYADNENARNISQNLLKDVDDYFASLLGKMSDEQKKFNDELKRVTDMYTKIDDFISGIAEKENVPYLLPVIVGRDTDNDEVVVINDYDKSLEGLISKMVHESTYIADISTYYKDYIFGVWLFSGAKIRIIAINPPTSPILAIEVSNREIDNRLMRIAKGPSEAL
jgi:hypothetical protein